MIGNPPNADALERLAGTVTYRGSAEHKSYPSPAGQPALKSDNARCDVFHDLNPLTEALRNGIRAGAISEALENGFPKYVWGSFQGKVYEARHLSTPAGSYKGYTIEAAEYPVGLEVRIDS